LAFGGKLIADGGSGTFFSRSRVVKRLAIDRDESNRNPARPGPICKKSKKKRGGQLGHPKPQRPLLPTDECDGRLRRRAATASGLGTSEDQTARDRVL